MGGSFYFTWLGQAVLCHNLTFKDIRRRWESKPQGHLDKEYSRQMEEQYSKRGGRNMLGAVCSMKSRVENGRNRVSKERRRRQRGRKGLDHVGLKGYRGLWLPLCIRWKALE